MKTLAVILARAGSKGIKGKNLANLAGKPLLYYTINAAKNAKCIDEIVLSSDGEDILKYGQTQGIKTLERPAHLASDTSTSTQALLHTLEHFVGFDTLILLQPTSPLRTNTHIDEAFKIYKNQNANALISVYECDNKLLKAFMLDENELLRGVCNDEFAFMPRQKLPPTFMSNGAIYIADIKAFLKRPSFLQSKTMHYLMDEKSSIDIDNAKDLLLAEKLLKA